MGGKKNEEVYLEERCRICIYLTIKRFDCIGS